MLFLVSFLLLGPPCHWSYCTLTFGLLLKQIILSSYFWVLLVIGIITLLPFGPYYYQSYCPLTFGSSLLLVISPTLFMTRYTGIPSSRSGSKKDSLQVKWDFDPGNWGRSSYMKIQDQNDDLITSRYFYLKKKPGFTFLCEKFILSTKCMGPEIKNKTTHAENQVCYIRNECMLVQRIIISKYVVDSFVI